MNRRVPKIPAITVGTIVVTPVNLNNVTKDKRYIVEGTYEGHIIIRDDSGELRAYYQYQFIEADIYFTMCLLSTFICIFNIGSKIYK